MTHPSRGDDPEEFGDDFGDDLDDYDYDDYDAFDDGEDDEDDDLAVTGLVSKPAGCWLWTW